MSDRCPKCGSDVQGQKFCPYCGEPLASAPAESAPGVGAVPPVATPPAGYQHPPPVPPAPLVPAAGGRKRTGLWIAIAGIAVALVAVG